MVGDFFQPSETRWRFGLLLDSTFSAVELLEAYKVMRRTAF